MNFPALFKKAFEVGASDVHLRAGRPAALRVGGALVAADPAPVPSDELLTQIRQMVPPHMNGGGYSYLPVEPFATSRSEAGYYAWRAAVSVSGSVVSCSETMGQADAMSFDHHLLGCRRVGGAACTSAQVDLLESSRPIYDPGAGTYRMIKVANDAPCSVIKNALP